MTSWFAGGITAHDISNPMQPKKLAHYMTSDGVAWAGHYYAGYMVTNDMVRGSEILDMPALREAEAAAKAAPAGEATRLGAPSVDMIDVLIPKVLPPRPSNQRAIGEKGGICVLPGRPFPKV